jgi:hypothetical protein
MGKTTLFAPLAASLESGSKSASSGSSSEIKKKMLSCVSSIE